jgi:hypothetical protein
MDTERWFDTQSMRSSMTAPHEELRALRRSLDARQIARATELLGHSLRETGGLEPERGARLLALSRPEVIWSLARYHGVSGLVYQRLQSLPGAPDSLLAALRSDFEASVHRHLRSTWELSQLKPMLDGTGVPWAVVKGPAAVELLYGGRGGRLYHDLDVLVDPSGFSQVLSALEASGLQQLDRNWAVLRREMRGEVHYRGASPLEIDLHWNLINMYRGRFRVPTSELLQRAVAVHLAGVEVCTLDPTDSLIHLCLHAAISGGDRIMWLKDIERAVTVRTPAWDDVVSRSRRWNVAAPVGLMLSRSAQFLGVQLPAGVIQDLISPGAMRLIRAVDRLFPWQRALGRLTSPNRLMARSIGQGPVRGAVWLVVRSIRNLEPDQERASSSFTPGGTEGDRTAFIESVMASEAD